MVFLDEEESYRCVENVKQERGGGVSKVNT